MKNENPNTTLPQKRAAVAIIRNEEKFLAITRSQTVRAPGQVCFPGGGVEDGETIAEALVREMQEELAILVNPIRPVWKSHSLRGFELNWWQAEIAEDQLIQPNPDEVKSFLWMTSAEMLALPNLLDSNLEFFQALQRGEFEI